MEFEVNSGAGETELRDFGGAQTPKSGGGFKNVNVAITEAGQIGGTGDAGWATANKRYFLVVERVTGCLLGNFRIENL